MKTAELLNAIGLGNLNLVRDLILETPSLKNEIIRPGKNRDYRPLTEAAVEAQLEILSFLIEAGCDVEEDCRYPMFRAALYGRCVPAMEMLVASGADINGVWADYGPPIIASCEGMSLTTMRWLLENGAQITGEAEGATKKVFWNALIHAALFEKHCRGFLALLLEFGADVNTIHPTKHGFVSTALHSVAGKGDVTGVRFLLKNGANTEISDSDGLKPIDVTKNKQVKRLLESF